MDKKPKQIKEKISEFLELPKDILLDLPRITLIGNMQLIIENHKGVIEYSKEKVRINSKSGIIRIVGQHLVIKTIITEEVIIIGNIDQVEFLK